MPNKRSDDKVLFRAFLTREERAELNRLVNETGAPDATTFIRDLLRTAIDENAKSKRLANKNATNNRNNNK